MNRRICAWLLALYLTATGASADGTLTGQITFQGRPVANAELKLMRIALTGPDKALGKGRTGDCGTFEIKYDPPKYPGMRLSLSRSPDGPNKIVLPCSECSESIEWRLGVTSDRSEIIYVVGHKVTAVQNPEDSTETAKINTLVDHLEEQLLEHISDSILDFAHEGSFPYISFESLPLKDSIHWTNATAAHELAADQNALAVILGTGGVTPYKDEFNIKIKSMFFHEAEYDGHSITRRVVDEFSVRHHSKISKLFDSGHLWGKIAVLSLVLQRFAQLSDGDIETKIKNLQGLLRTLHGTIDKSDEIMEDDYMMAPIEYALSELDRTLSCLKDVHSDTQSVSVR